MNLIDWPRTHTKMEPMDKPRAANERAFGPCAVPLFAVLLAGGQALGTLFGIDGWRFVVGDIEFWVRSALFFAACLIWLVRAKVVGLGSSTGAWTSGLALAAAVALSGGAVMAVSSLVRELTQATGVGLSIAGAAVLSALSAPILLRSSKTGHTRRQE